ncbi:MAG: hypothetical protein LBR07_01150 [Puniceicoccales bacterium]|jgi:DNA polymerase-3 subunit delta'|nr:hypothetical protein [Puniceicoccales bacterium]
MQLNAETTLLRAFDEGRLPHGILLHGPDAAALDAAAKRIAARIFNSSDTTTGGGTAASAPDSHPDFHLVRPGGKARKIAIEDVRELNQQIQKTTNRGGRKVVLVSEVDRMDAQVADTFLKTLEEPPADTTIFLTTTRPRQLLDTVRSRTLHFRIPAPADAARDPLWDAWLNDFDDWLCDLTGGGRMDATRAADLIFALYGLAARFNSLLAVASAEQWELVKATLPEDMDDEEMAAAESGAGKNIRSARLAEIALRLCEINARQPDAAGIRALHASLRELEHAASLLDLNMATPAAIEYFFLRLLRIWTAR